LIAGTFKPQKNAPNAYLVVGKDVASGQELFQIPLDDGFATSFVFSSDAKTAAMARVRISKGAQSTFLVVLDPATGKKLCEVPGSEGMTLSLSPDGSLLASADFDKFIRVWDTKTGKQVCAVECRASQYASLDISPDNKLLAA